MSCSEDGRTSRAMLALIAVWIVMCSASTPCRAVQAPSQPSDSTNQAITTFTIKGNAVQVSQASGGSSVQAAGTREQSATQARPQQAGLDAFLWAYAHQKEPDKAMAEFLEAVRRNTIPYDDKEKLGRALSCVAQYYVDHPNDQEFSDLVLRMLDEPRIDRIVNAFYVEARTQKKTEQRKLEQGTLDSTKVKAEQYMNLYRLAVKAEEKWWAPVQVSIRGIGSRALPGDVMSYSVTASNRAGRATALPANLVVEVVPPDAVDHDAKAARVTAKRVGEFVLRASTPDGQLRAEHSVVVEAVAKADPPSAAMTPEGGVFEVNQLVKLTVTANPTLQRDRWAVDWDPHDLIHALKTYEDPGKVVMTIRGRRWGTGLVKVMANNAELTRAQLFVLPPNPSKSVPLGLTASAIAAYATGVSAGSDGHYTARRWLTLGVTPVLGAAAAYKWYQYFKAKKVRQHFLDQVPPSALPKPPEATAGAAPRSSGQE